MSIDASFHAKYQAGQERARVQAEEKDGHIFVPDLEPEGKVDWVLVCMEPSLDGWTTGVTPQERRESAAKKIGEGFRNHLPSGNVAILHFCTSHYLCTPDQRYHIIDLSKGAMLVEDASRDRQTRWSRWYPLVQEEIELVTTPKAGIIAVGGKVHEFLVEQRAKQRLPRRLVDKIVHYSDSAKKWWRDGIKDHEDEFEAFKVKDKVSLYDLEITARDVMRSGRVSTKICDEEISQLRELQLNASQKGLISRQHLMFNYKLAFESMRQKLECSG
jgi:hypothetical protein